MARHFPHDSQRGLISDPAGSYLGLNHAASFPGVPRILLPGGQQKQQGQYASQNLHGSYLIQVTKK